MRTGFYGSSYIVRDNKVGGEPLFGFSVGLYINDGMYNCTCENNEV